MYMNYERNRIQNERHEAILVIHNTNEIKLSKFIIDETKKRILLFYLAFYYKVIVQQGRQTEIESLTNLSVSTKVSFKNYDNEEEKETNDNRI